MTHPILSFIPDPHFARGQVRLFGHKLLQAEVAHEMGKISDAKLIQMRMAHEAALISLELSKQKPN